MVSYISTSAVSSQGMRNVWMLALCLAFGTEAFAETRCRKDVFTKVKKGCMNKVDKKADMLDSSSSDGCRDLENYAQCMRKSLYHAHCDNFAYVMKAQILAIEKEMKNKCAHVNGPGHATLGQLCHPHSAVKLFFECNRNFYNEVPLPARRTVLVPAMVCPKVYMYTACVQRSRDAANCTIGKSLLPHMDYVAESVSDNYRALCHALRHSAPQKKTDCNRKRFINGMFQCGYRFANIVETMGNTVSPAVCPHLDKYRKCHNASVDTLRCPHPDKLYDAAKFFYNGLTRRFVETCRRNATKVRLVAKSPLDDAALSCDVNRFMRYFFVCASAFMKDINLASEERICRLVSTYKDCVAGSRHAALCDAPMELNTHLDYLQNYILHEHEANCVNIELKIRNDPYSLTNGSEGNGYGAESDAYNGV